MVLSMFLSTMLSTMFARKNLCVNFCYRIVSEDLMILILFDDGLFDDRRIIVNRV